ncbi:MAG: endonuclease [Weeksellaceae bacterium]|jgi:endonuclease I|nr:endonuclease [Weeksellaceae bacterium]
MKKGNLSFLLLFLSLSITTLAQIPNGYYDGTQNLTGFTLKTKLHTIIKDFDSQSYNSLKDLYAGTNAKNGFRDRYYEEDDTVLDIYSENPDGPDAYNYNPDDPMGSGANEGDAFNREHLIPQSYFDSNSPMRSDAFHVWPADSKVNGWRDNYGFGTVSNAQNATPCNSGATNLPCKSLNGTLKGKFTENSSITVVEPIDEFKGDIARVFLYFATCYENLMPGFYNSSNAAVKTMFDGSANKVFSDDFLEVLIAWHLMDPPSQREKDLNDYIYYTFQENRNPYIDHPEFASIIWGIGLNTDELEYQTRKDVIVYTTSMKEVVIRLENPEKSIERVWIYDTNGNLIQTQENKSAQTELRLRLPQNGVYILKIEGKRLEFNTKVLIN